VLTIMYVQAWSAPSPIENLGLENRASGHVKISPNRMVGDEGPPKIVSCGGKQPRPEITNE
jgi:hypothetical protein